MNHLKERLKNVGPGALVAAAFIGPGTVNTATLSGASYGYTLLWAMLFSTIATMIFQEMAARLGVVSRQGLGEALRNQFTHPILKYAAILLVISAIFIGNSAYETGNIMGGVMGINAVFPDINPQVWGPLIGVVAFILLWSGNYKRIEKIFVILVITMSITFLATAILTQPNLGDLFSGLFIPSVPGEGGDGWLTVVGLIGTTVVPYNLFLHASAVQERWADKSSVKEVRTDTILSIALGGLISISVIITASSAFYGIGENPTSGAEMAVQLEPLLGAAAQWMFAIGLFAAGFTSAVSAPLAAAYATSGALGWEKNLRSMKFRSVWMFILFVGIVFSALGGASPTEVILFAQAANALILPIIAIFLMVVVNNKKIMGEYTNGLKSNLLGIIVIIVAIAVSTNSFISFIEGVQRLFTG